MTRGFQWVSEQRCTAECRLAGRMAVFPFAAVAIGVTPPAAELDAARLEATLASFVDAAHRAWPDVALDDETFVTALARAWADDGAPTWERLEELVPADLYLATACLAQNERAQWQFSQTLMPQVEASLARLDRGGVVTDIMQHLRQALLMPRADGAPRLASYSGRALLHWVRTVAVREALKWQRRESRQGEVETHAMADDAPLVDPELEIIRRLHSNDFRDAFATAFSGLTPKSETCCGCT